MGLTGRTRPAARPRGTGATPRAKRSPAVRARPNAEQSLGHPPSPPRHSYQTHRIARCVAKSGRSSPPCRRLSSTDPHLRYVRRCLIGTPQRSWSASTGRAPAFARRRPVPKNAQLSRLEVPRPNTCEKVTPSRLPNHQDRSMHVAGIAQPHTVTHHPHFHTGARLAAPATLSPGGMTLWLLHSDSILIVGLLGMMQASASRG